MIAEFINKSVEDRSLFIASLESLFNEQTIVPLIIFINLKFTISKLYDSYLTELTDYKDLAKVRKLSKRFWKKTGTQS